MIWPTTLVSCALFNTLHSQDYTGIGSYGGMKRERFFLIFFIAVTVWCKSITYETFQPSNWPPLTRYLPWVPLRGPQHVHMGMLDCARQCQG